jgi:hypothetical protein
MHIHEETLHSGKGIHVSKDKLIFETALLAVSMIQKSEVEDPTQDKQRNIIPSQYKDIFDVPNSFEQAWNHQDPFQRRLWQTAINKEFKTMEDHQVWDLIDRQKIPHGRIPSNADGSLRLNEVECLEQD